jgi:hypothetical protein
VKRRVLAFLSDLRFVCVLLESLSLHLPDTKLVGEVEQRTECRTGRKQHTGERHFLSQRKRAVAVGASVAIYMSLAHNSGEKNGRANVPLRETYSCGKYMPKVKPVKAPKYPGLGAAVALRSES